MVCQHVGTAQYSCQLPSDSSSHFDRGLHSSPSRLAGMLLLPYFVDEKTEIGKCHGESEGQSWDPPQGLDCPLVLICPRLYCRLKDRCLLSFSWRWRWQNIKAEPKVVSPRFRVARSVWLFLGWIGDFGASFRLFKALSSQVTKAHGKTWHKTLISLIFQILNAHKLKQQHFGGETSKTVTTTNQIEDNLGM